MSYKDRVLKVLVLDERLSDFEIIMNEMSRLGQEFSYKRLSSCEELSYELKASDWDLIITDHVVNGFHITEIIKLIRKISTQLPIILYADKVATEELVQLLKIGLDDLVLKKRSEKLASVVRSVLRDKGLKAKEEETKKLAKEAFASREQMLAVVSHDIKNPLFAIQLEAHMLLRAAKNETSKLSNEVKLQANRILSTTERMKGLILDLLDKNKTENNLSNIMRIDLDARKLVQEVIDALGPLMDEKDIKLVSRMPETVSRAQLDRNKMFQVLSNLLNNAIKFSPHSGTILIELEDRPQEIVLRVSDEGPGLCMKNSQKVFDKYWSGEGTQCGTGLGLYICKTIIEAHGGLIDAENRQSGGASFWFRVPKDQNVTLTNSNKNQTDQQKKICIIDDDDDLREVMSWALGNEGFATQTFHGPKEALGYLSHPRSKPELIVVDFQMDEMKGSEFLLKKNQIAHIKDCPVLMISASPQEAREELAPDSCKEVITKPIDLTGLVRLVKKYIS